MEEIRCKSNKCCKSNNSATGGGGAVYGPGFIGALVYFVQNSDGFWLILLAILKAMVWPAFVVYELLKSFFS